MINTIILMAGKGTRFAGLDGERPKPLVRLHGQPLLRWVVENLRLSVPQRFTFVALEEHIREYKLSELFSTWEIDFQICPVTTVTKGAACSALLAENFFANDELVIANSDQYLFFNPDNFIKEVRNKKAEGSIVTMNASGPKWSYARVGDDGLVKEIREKEAISSIGTVGVYYFQNGKIFQEAVSKMIAANDTYNDEFYLAPVYNYVRGPVTIFHIGDVDVEMIGLGTKEDFLKFHNSVRSYDEAKKLFS